MQHSPALPKLIALCGNPLSGKSTVAELLNINLGYAIADDGMPMRHMAMDYLGLSHDQVFTQAGKMETVLLNNKDYTVREILGQIGNAFEEKFGGAIIPLMTHATLNPDVNSVMTSVRREQGGYWKSQGALVIEIVNPQAGPSNYAFDSYNRAHVDVTILNDGLFRGLAPDAARADLLEKLCAVLDIQTFS